MQQLIYFAQEATAPQAGQGPDLFSALGINPALLAMQAGAFLILLLIMAKFVYPPLLRAIEKRRETIETGLARAKQAEEKLASVEDKVAAMLHGARTEAGDIVASSKQEAATIIEAAEARGAKRAESIVADAHIQMANELAAAREALKHETAKLVARATEQIIKEKLDATKDARLIAASLREAK
jgi:F-type H+-transporting ATPase subunit b